MVVTTNSHCKSFIVSRTIFYSWDYYNYIVKSIIISTIIYLYYIFLVDVAIKNSCRLRELLNIETNTIYFSAIVKNTTEKKIWYFLLYFIFPGGDKNTK